MPRRYCSHLSMQDMSEKRVGDMESLVWEIPNILNLRFERFQTEHAFFRKAIEDNTDRLKSIERIMMLVQADMRDRRSGVTRQLVAQDETIRALVKRVEALDGEVNRQFATIDQRLKALEVGQTALERRQAALEKGLDALEKGLHALEKRQAALEEGLEALAKGQVSLEARQAAFENVLLKKLDEIMRRLPKA